MSGKNEEVKKMMDALKRQRDELKLKIHLAKADAADEWDKAEEKWGHLKAKAHSVREEAEGSSKDVTAAAKLLVDEIKRGYERIRKAL